MSTVTLYTKDYQIIDSEVNIFGSKSISNRLLLIRALSKKNFNISNISKSKDTLLMQLLLNNSNEYILDAGDAGTVYRFITAYLALKPGKQFLTGSKRMLERPIAILVEALNKLGADIKYAGKENYPPLNINNPKLGKSYYKTIHLDASVSSQYISALLMIAPTLQKGLEIVLSENPVSQSYIEMTLFLMKEFGAQIIKKENVIHVSNGSYLPKDILVESDWSSISYFYTIAALYDGPVNLRFNTFFENSLQGDSVICKIMEKFGITSTFSEIGTLQVRKVKTILPEYFEYDFTNCPDLAQTICVLLAALKIPSLLTGLKTLKIKETDRIEALQKELLKFGAVLETTHDEIRIIKGIEDNIIPTIINTYNDHRMAMSFAPLVLKTGKLKIENKDVVNKSYPDFWADFKNLGFGLK